MSEPVFSKYPGSDILGPLMNFVSTTKATADDVTITVDQLINGLWLRDPAGSNRADTTPTAFEIVSAIPGARVGSSFFFFIRNTADAAETITLTGGTDVTINGTETVAQNTTGLYFGVVTAVGATPTVTLFRGPDGLTSIAAFNAENTITAHAGGTKAAAYVLTKVFNRIATVGTIDDSVLLPAATAGTFCVIVNDAALAARVFGAGTATIDGVASATGNQVPGKSTTVFYCPATDIWFTVSKSYLGLVAASADGAINPNRAAEIVITKGSAAALTLAAPTATSDDGKVIRVTSTTAFAHAITATNLLMTGDTPNDVATFAAVAGASVTLMAYQANWYVLASNQITFS